MRLWLLRPVGYDDPAASLGKGEHDNPWTPWYNKAFGFVVRAEDESSARKFAHEDAGTENRGTFLGLDVAETDSPWLDPDYSTCEELSPEGPEGIVMRDFASA